MIQKKIAMLGMWGVGKTSLIRQYVHGRYSEKYQSTLGVTIEKKIVQMGSQTTTLLLWDIAGAEENFPVPLHYVSGAAGYLLVLDGTRRSSLPVAIDLHKSVQDGVGGLPFITVINKCDLSCELTPTEVQDSLANLGGAVFQTSAKTGVQVDAAFKALVAAL